MKKPIMTAMIMAVIVLSGCESIPQKPVYQATEASVKKDLVKWEKVPAVELREAKVIGNILSPSGGIPSSILNKRVYLQLSSEATMADLAGALSQENIPFIIGDEEISSIKMFIPRFEGTVGNLLRGISQAHKISFSWKGGMLMPEKRQRYVLSLVQDVDFAKEVSSQLQEMGAENVHISTLSSTVSYEATHDVQDVINDYLKRISKNAALVTLQVSIVTVSLARERDIGIDWNSLNIKTGNLALGATQQAAMPAVNGGGAGTTGAAGGTGATGTRGTNASGAAAAAATAVNAVSEMGELFQFDGSSFSAGVKLLRKSLDISSAVRMLNTYGNTKTMQDVQLRTLSGNEVSIDSAEKIPYVAEITNTINSVNTGNTGAGGQTGFSSGVTSGTKIEEIEVGLNLKLLPYFDAESGLVTIGVDLELDQLKGFMEVSAGNQIGALTRPLTQKQGLTDLVRLQAGETVVIGGLRFESDSDNRSAPEPVKNFLAKKKTKKDTTALFIIIRPSVVVYGDKAALTQLADNLFKTGEVWVSGNRR